MDRLEYVYDHMLPHGHHHKDKDMYKPIQGGRWNWLSWGCIRNIRLCSWFRHLFKYEFLLWWWGLCDVGHLKVKFVIQNKVKHVDTNSSQLNKIVLKTFLTLNKLTTRAFDIKNKNIFQLIYVMRNLKKIVFVVISSIEVSNTKKLCFTVFIHETSLKLVIMRNVHIYI